MSFNPLDWITNFKSYVAIGGLAFGVLVGGGGVIYGLIEHGNYQSEVIARKDDKIKAQQAVEKARLEDREQTEAIIVANEQKIEELKGQFDAERNAIRAAAPSNACGGSPPMQSLFDRVRQRQRATGPRR